MNTFPESFLIAFDAHGDHESWLKKLVESGFESKNIILVGLRRISQQERIFLEENRIRYYEMRNIESKEDVCDAIMELSQGNSLYVSFDIDVVDPAFAPGTGNLEPGGFSSQEILYFARRMARMKNLKALDIVEVFADDKLTVKLASRILREFI
jgi:arginase family enzyme